jgi:threonine synthase
MRYISTRGQAPDLSFADVLLTGLASDGGLYVPETWPQFTHGEIAALAGLDYAEVALRVLLPFVGEDVPEAELRRMCETAYASFAHEAVVPLVQVGPQDWILELFHGPTLAFKDVAMQLLGQLFDYVLAKRGARTTIIGATSGDTGGAAIEALKGLSAVDVFILHPEGRISDVQRRLMTCVPDKNIHNIAVQGSFDDCQALVKEMFADAAFRERISMGAINSINWARIMAQAVYYFTSVVALGRLQGPALSFAVPTGNFGDVFAGYVARKMGLPVNMFCVATNRNDILHRALSTGEYRPDSVAQTISPSMDIQVSSNFERLLFEESGRDADAVRAMMSGLKQGGGFSIPADVLKSIQQQFVSARSDEAETTAKIKEMHETTGEVVDPHTAVGLVAVEKARAAGQLEGAVVTLATAHPAKFPEAVKEACGVYPGLPAHMSDLFEREEHLSVLPNEMKAVQEFVLARVG